MITIIKGRCRSGILVHRRRLGILEGNYRKRYLLLWRITPSGALRYGGILNAGAGKW
jgi:hypothetical protein